MRCLQWASAPTNSLRTDPKSELRPHILIMRNCPTCEQDLFKETTKDLMDKGVYVLTPSGNDAVGQCGIGQPPANYEEVHTIG